MTLDPHFHGKTLAEAEHLFHRLLLKQALIGAKGNACKAADALGVHRNTYSRIANNVGLNCLKIRSQIKRGAL